MADKFPPLDTVNNVDEANSNTGETDFLSREKELVGDEFKTDQDQEVLADSDDDISQFKEQFPEVGDSEPAEASAGESEYVEASNGNSEPLLDSKHLKEWKERRDLEISQREEVNAKKKEEIISSARQTIDDFYENYNNKREESSKQVYKEQEEFLKKRDDFLKNGTLWDRVNEIVGDVGELPQDEDRDKSRFKELLTKFKGKESIPGAGGY